MQLASQASVVYSRNIVFIFVTSLYGFPVHTSVIGIHYGLSAAVRIARWAVGVPVRPENITT